MRTRETSHFYLGRVTDTARFNDFFAEHYDRDDDGPISAFYASQGERFCDHDFMETGERSPGASLEEFFAPHSYASEWSAALCEAARSKGLDDANALLFINTEQIAQPRSVTYEGFELVYVGAIGYSI